MKELLKFNKLRVSVAAQYPRVRTENKVVASQEFFGRQQRRVKTRNTTVSAGYKRESGESTRKKGYAYTHKSFEYARSQIPRYDVCECMIYVYCVNVYMYIGISVCMYHMYR